jgi:hypothetical protein
MNGSNKLMTLFVVMTIKAAIKQKKTPYLNSLLITKEIQKPKQNSSSRARRETSLQHLPKSGVLKIFFSA